MVGRISRWSVALVVLALLLIGCGGGDESTQEASATPTPEVSLPPAPEPTRSAAPKESGKQKTYVVKSGDTLSAIAKRFDTTVNAIVKANDIKDPDVIAVGDKFVIPQGQ